MLFQKSPIDLFSNSNNILDFAFRTIHGLVSLDRPQCIRTQDGLAIVKRSISLTVYKSVTHPNTNSLPWLKSAKSVWVGSTNSLKLMELDACSHHSLANICTNCFCWIKHSRPRVLLDIVWHSLKNSAWMSRPTILVNHTLTLFSHLYHCIKHFNVGTYVNRIHWCIKICHA